MNDLLDNRVRESQPVKPRHELVRIVRNANGSLPYRDRSELRWLDVTVRTIESRRANLELTHWKKVRRSVAEY